MTERIQKLLAEAGVASRRQIERWITEGRIIVDGRLAQIGERLSGRERVFVNGRRVQLDTGRRRASHSFLAYYKPAGELTSRGDPEERDTVFDSLPAPKHGRWISVGRLDMSTSGLLLFTTDGELAHRLMHPRYGIEREYAVRLLGEPSEEQIERLRTGVELDDGPAQVESIAARGGTGSNVWYHAVMREGRNREVRRLFDAVGLVVSRLIRVRYGPVELGQMRRGGTRRLTPPEVAALYGAVSLERTGASPGPPNDRVRSASSPRRAARRPRARR